MYINDIKNIDEYILVENVLTQWVRVVRLKLSLKQRPYIWSKVIDKPKCFKSSS